MFNSFFISLFSFYGLLPNPIIFRPLREIFQNLKQTVAAKFGSSSNARYSAVSSFLFLRHICPAILNPKLFGLAQGNFYFFENMIHLELY